MSLPHVLLGLLQSGPRTGYELARAMREEIDPVWGAGFSQIYPALARLRRKGWALLRVLGPRLGPRRLLYRATAAGRRELQRWLQEPAPPRRNDPCLARIAFLDALPPPARQAAQSTLETALAAEVARWKALPVPEGFRGLARRAAVEERDALARFLRSGGASTSALAPPAGRKTPGRGRAPVRRKSPPRSRSGRMIPAAREEP